MDPRRSCSVALALLALETSCARPPYLRWQGGDAFGVSEAGGRSPSRIDCPGTTEERFACLGAKVRERVAGTSSALAVVEGDGAVLQTTTTEAGQTVPTTSETPFPLASVTKMFTAATAVSLAQGGLLDLHRPIASYLPELDVDSELGRVTLHQLLTHTAGLVDALHPQCEGGGDLSDAIAHAHLGAQPGEVHLYSNVGYALVGLVIERTTSRPFEEVVRERVLLPMGMSTATFDFASVPVRGHPEGAGARHRCRLMAPAGGLNASARDVARWARAMSEPITHPLGRQLVEALTTPYVELGTGPGVAYGYGVVARRRGDVWVYYHSGGLDDFSAMAAWVPERRFGAAATMNATNAAGATPSVIVLRGLSVLLDLPDDWSAVEGSPRASRAYVGTYVDRRSWLGRVRVRLEGDRLVVDRLDGRPAPLPATWVFRFAPGEERARFLVTFAGVGERVADE
jgi:CubicO group peptidase (beta-lactamase class C family)